MSDGQQDGRRARTTRGRQAALDAIMAVLAEGGEVRGMAHLAEISGIPERTFFRYFENQDGVFRAIAETLLPRAVAVATLAPPDAPLDVRLRALAELRVRTTKEFGAGIRTVDRFARSFEAAETLRRNRDELSARQVREWLGPECRNLDKGTLAVINEMYSLTAVEHLISVLGRSAATALGDNVVALVRARLGSTPKQALRR